MATSSSPSGPNRAQTSRASPRSRRWLPLVKTPRRPPRQGPSSAAAPPRARARLLRLRGARGALDQLWAARRPRREAGPRSAQPPPRVVEPAASHPRPESSHCLRNSPSIQVAMRREIVCDNCERQCPSPADTQVSHSAPPLFALPDEHRPIAGCELRLAWGARSLSPQPGTSLRSPFGRP